MGAITNRHRPHSGLHRPTAWQMIMATMLVQGFIPYEMIMGATSGTMMVMAAPQSINAPSSSMHSSTAQRWPCGAALQSSFPLILTIPFSLHCFMQNAMGYLLLREIKLLPLFYLI